VETSRSTPNVTFVGTKLMSGSRRVLTTQTSSAPTPPSPGQGSATDCSLGASARADRASVGGQEHNAASAARVNKGWDAVKKRKADTERMETQPKP
jgi:hypothetical protein